MHNSLKKFYATLLTVILAMVLFVPVSAFAQSGTLGTENPHIYATFKDSDDVTVCGDDLEEGSYTVSIHLSGMQSVSIFQITADVSNITISNVSTIADVDDSFSCGAIKNEDGSFVAILASENDDTSAIADGTVMVTFNVAVDVAGDFSDMFVLSTDPDLTFVEADYGDGFDDAYVCTENEGELALITYDMSPELTQAQGSVSGKVTIATNLNATSGTIGIGGITVSAVGTELSTSTASDGTFTLSGLDEGNCTLLIAGESTIDKNVTLVVSGEMVIDDIPIIICDYNRDGKVNTLDKGIFSSTFNKPENYNKYCDLNQDSKVNTLDKGIFSVFFNKIPQK